MPTMLRWTFAVVAALLGLADCSGGGVTGARHALGDAGIAAVEVVARAGMFRRPLDAAPSPDGRTIYFVATGDQGPGIFSVDDRADVSALASAAPMVRPSAIAVSTDGSRLFVADARAGGPDTTGAVLTTPTGGGPAVPGVLGGTEGRSPHGLDVVRGDGGDVVYFTGTDPSTGSPGLFQVPAGGGAATTVAEGAPFTSLDSVVVTAQGVAYVTDRGAIPGQGSVFRVSGGAVTPVVSGLRLGAPAGVSLVNGDDTLLVSSNAAGNLSDQLLFVDLATGRMGAAGKGIGANTDSSGGLHRAYGARVLAWADTKGQIFRVRPQ